MVAVLTVTPEERPALAYVLARLVPMLRLGVGEDQEVANHLAFALHGLEQAPAGPGEIEFVAQDLYALGTHIYAAGADLEEYWLDLVEIARGRRPVEKADPNVQTAADRFYPEIRANPEAWNFKQAEPALIDLGFKLDALTTEETPRARGLYNKTRAAINRVAIARRERNNEIRAQMGAATLGPRVESGRALLPAPLAGGSSVAVEEPEAWAMPAPAGTATLRGHGPDSRLSVVSRATYPPQYEWGVETATGVMAADLDPNKPRKLNLGGTQLMLVLVEGKVCAVSRICTHRAWDLSGSTANDGVITCGLHGAQYDVCSGAVVRGPFSPEFNREHALMGGLMAALDPKHTCEALSTYPTRIAESGEILIHI